MTTLPFTLYNARYTRNFIILIIIPPFSYIYRTSIIVLVLLRYIIVIVHTNFLWVYWKSAKLMHALNSSNHLGFTRWKYKFPHSFHYILFWLEKLGAFCFPQRTKHHTWMNRKEHFSTLMSRNKWMEGEEINNGEVLFAGIKETFINTNF